MMAQKKELLKLNRNQLYTLAAKASFGEGTKMVIDPSSFDPDKETVVFALDVRKSAPASQQKDKHKNGWSYYRINKEGHIKALKEDEL